MVKKLLTLVLLLIIVGLMVGSVYSNFGQLRGYHWQVSLGRIGLIVISVAPLYLLSAYSWHRVIRACGAKISFSKNLHIWMLANVSRYLPGGVWQYASRFYLLQKEGLSKVVISNALILEALFSLASGSLLVFGVLLVWPGQVIGAGVKEILLVVLCLPIVFILVLNSSLAEKILGRLLVLLGKKVDRLRLDFALSGVPLIVLTYIAQFISGGLVLFWLVGSVRPLDMAEVIVLIGIYALSWILGYVSIFSPSGLGVQELSMASLLSVYMPFYLGSLVAIMFRVVMVLAEIVTLAVILALLRLTRWGR